MTFTDIEAKEPSNGKPETNPKIRIGWCGKAGMLGQPVGVKCARDPIECLSCQKDGGCFGRSCPWRHY